jgi:sarcosine oxidase subunit gamma
MLQDRSPLAGRSIEVAGQLSVRPAEECARFSLRLLPESIDAAEAALGSPLPRRIGEMSSADGRLVLCLGPDEWHLILPAGDGAAITARFAELYTHHVHSLVDVSHRETGIIVEGQAARLTLNAASPLDLERMPPGTAARTVFDRAQIILMRESETRFRIEVWRSFAPHVWGLLEASAKEAALGI